MSKIVRYDEEKRRRELTNKLITYGVYKIDNTSLLKLSLPDLEKEYKRLQADAHPHCTSGLRWVNKR
ncbi:Fur-regulated basic protein FbpA [Neobacillus niacini]|uniref:Fur-regulated basic protein FbpA n=1 Tax=Neobacillus niacini TaxID=86668 RepID=UPI002FFFBA0F